MRIRQWGSDHGNFYFSFSILSIFDFYVQFELQFANPQTRANPHRIKENKETSFAVQPNRVRIAKDVSLGGPEGIRTLDLSDANRTLSQLSYKPKFPSSVFRRCSIPWFASFDANRTLFLLPHCRSRLASHSRHRRGCHSFLLAASATGGARKRPQLSYKPKRLFHYT